MDVGVASSRTLSSCGTSTSSGVDEVDMDIEGSSCDEVSPV